VSGELRELWSLITRSLHQRERQDRGGQDRVGAGPDDVLHEGAQPEEGKRGSKATADSLQINSHRWFFK
jgi:hypothetical protein